MAPAQGVLHRATFTLGVISLILNFASAFTIQKKSFLKSPHPLTLTTPYPALKK